MKKIALICLFLCILHLPNFTSHAVDIYSFEISSEAAKASISTQANDTLDSDSFSDTLLGKIVIGGLSGIVFGAIAGIVWHFRHRNLPSSNSSSQQSPRICPNCGAELRKGSVYCDHCGTSIPDGIRMKK